VSCTVDLHQGCLRFASQSDKPVSGRARRGQGQALRARTRP
jgi:hypothetical protein